MPVLYLAVTVISISSHEVDTVAVFIPECSLIGQGAVGDSNIIVVVISGEWATMVVGHRVTYKDSNRERERELTKWSVVQFLLGTGELQVNCIERRDKLKQCLNVWLQTTEVIFTCRSTVSSYMDFVAGPRFRDRELVVLSVGRFVLISQVDSELVLTSSCDLMQVGKTWEREIIYTLDGQQ